MFKSFLKILLYLVLSLLLALFIRLFLCNFYRVPSDSMSPTVITGDFILTEKWTYGARVFTGLKLNKHGEPSMIRIPGFGRVQRGDVVVFNFPYRSYHSAWDTIHMHLNLFLVKRCIGLPGDTLSVADGYYRIAGISDTMGYIPEQKRLARYRGELEPAIYRTFPYDSVLNWNIRDFGPLYVPAAGTAIPLTPKNVVLYGRQMVYETDAVIRTEGSSVYVNDTLKTHYTFRRNWYFMAGDNVMNSQDSRYIGMIPETYVIGKASVILSSKDRYTGKRRWNRFLKRIK